MSKSITIGLLSPVTGGSYYGKILAGVTREVAAVGGRVVLVQTLHAGISSDVEVGAPDFVTPIAWEHVDGVISIATATQRNYLDRLQAAGKAVVLASDVFEGFDAPSATPDNSTGVVASVDHLIWHGHTAIGYGANLVQPDMRARYDAYQRALKAHGIDPDPKWFFAACRQRRAGRSRRRPAVRRSQACRSLPSPSPPIATRSGAWSSSPSSESPCPAMSRSSASTAWRRARTTRADAVDRVASPTKRSVRRPLDSCWRSSVAKRSSLALTCRRRSSCPAARAAVLVRTDRPGPTGEPVWRVEAVTRFARSRRQRATRCASSTRSASSCSTTRAAIRGTWTGLPPPKSAARASALWDGDPSTGVCGSPACTTPSASCRTWSGRPAPLEQFPPASLIGLADPQANEVTIVVPVKAGGLDFGLLAVTGEVDALSANGRETHNQWAVLLTAALEQQNLIETVRASEERYSL